MDREVFAWTNSAVFLPLQCALSNPLEHSWQRRLVGTVARARILPVDIAMLPVELVAVCLDSEVWETPFILFRLCCSPHTLKTFGNEFLIEVYQRNYSFSPMEDLTKYFYTFECRSLLLGSNLHKTQSRSDISVIKKLSGRSLVMYLGLCRLIDGKKGMFPR